MRNRCLILRHDKLQFFDEAEILYSANIYSSACHADEGSIYPSCACVSGLLHVGLFLTLFRNDLQYKSATQQAINSDTEVWPIKLIGIYMPLMLVIISIPREL